MKKENPQNVHDNGDFLSLQLALIELKVRITLTPATLVSIFFDHYLLNPSELSLLAVAFLPIGALIGVLSLEKWFLMQYRSWHKSEGPGI
ncbi:MAG: hypothetical protein MUE95_10865 [Cyclobacteriaceae bacterium]|nr:hypothetical protein [Cyclobacteriaceae bacterium]